MSAPDAVFRRSRRALAAGDAAVIAAASSSPLSAIRPNRLRVIGAMITGAALDELERTGRETALCTLCVTSAMPAASLFERV